MIVYLTFDEILALHQAGIDRYGGSPGVRDRGLIESAVIQPQTSFFGEPQYPTLADKAAALGYALVSNHGFIDGNKRIGHLAMDVFLRMNGYRIRPDLEEQYATFIAVASGAMLRDEFSTWVSDNIEPYSE